MTHGSEKRQRTVHLGVRLTEAERAIIEAAAERAGLLTASYAREVLLCAPVPRQVRRPPIERRELVRILGQLGHIGANINMIAKALLGGREADLHALDEGLADLMVMRNALLEALGRSP